MKLKYAKPNRNIIRSTAGFALEAKYKYPKQIEIYNKKNRNAQYGKNPYEKGKWICFEYN